MVDIIFSNLKFSYVSAIYIYIYIYPPIEKKRHRNCRVFFFDEIFESVPEIVHLFRIFMECKCIILQIGTGVYDMTAF